ncbi:unnamed protein product, partial [Hapterophycus canaliculatus]
GGYTGYDRDTRDNRDNRGGRSGYAGRDGRNREYDRRSGTGRLVGDGGARGNVGFSSFSSASTTPHVCVFLRRFLVGLPPWPSRERRTPRPLLPLGREVKKSGGGGRNWGNDAAAGMDNAAASAALDAEGGAGWAANGNAAEDPEAAEVVDGEAADGAESPKDDTPAPPAREPEPEEIQLPLDEHQAMLDAKAKE